MYENVFKRIEEKYFHCENCVFKDVFLCTQRREAKRYWYDKRKTEKYYKRY